MGNKHSRSKVLERISSGARTTGDRVLARVSSKARERRLVASLDRKLAEVIMARAKAAEQQKGVKVRFNR